MATFAPLAAHYARSPQDFSGREKEISLLNDGARGMVLIARQARDVALSPLVRGDHVAKHNIPGPPRFVQFCWWGSDGADSVAQWIDASRSGRELPDVHGTGLATFDVATGAVFFLGLLLAFRRGLSGSWADALLVAWLGIGSLASILSFGAPNLLRLLFLTPVAAALIAGAMVALCDRLLAWSRWLALGALAAWMGWYGAGESWRYFHVWPRHPAVYYEFNSDMADLAATLRTAQHPPGTIVLPRHLHPAPTLRFLLDEVDGVVSDEKVKSPPSDRFWIVDTLPPHPRLQMPIPADRPVGVIAEVRLPGDRVWARILEVAPAAPAAP